MISRLGLSVGDRRGSALVACSAGVTALLLSFALGAVARGIGVAPAMTIVLVLAVMIWAVTVRSELLPPVALVLYVVLPQQFIGYGYFGLTPATLLMGIWAIRRILGKKDSSPQHGFGRAALIVARLSISFLVGWAVYLEWGDSIGIPLQGPTGAEWIISLAVGFAIVIFVRVTDRESQLVIRSFGAVSIVAGAYAVGEVALQQNPIYTPLYEIVGRGVDVGGEFHRASVSFGHPLYAATFFTVAFAIFFVRWLDSLPGSVAPLVGATVGAVATLSRGALLVVASIVGVLILARLGRLWHDHPGKILQLVSFLGIAAVALLASGLAQERSGTAEAATSAEVRRNIVPEALNIAQRYHWQGAGPASADTLMLTYSNGEYPMENSALQLLVSLGILGVFLFILTIVGLVCVAVTRGNAAGAVGLAAFSAVIIGYNALESLLPVHSLLGFLALLCVCCRDNQGPDLRFSVLSELDKRHVGRTRKDVKN